MDYNNLDNINYVECASCSEKPGSPTLCYSCLYNRSAIDYLQRLIREFISFVPKETLLVAKDFVDPKDWKRD